MCLMRESPVPRPRANSCLPRDAWFHDVVMTRGTLRGLGPDRLRSVEDTGMATSAEREEAGVSRVRKALRASSAELLRRLERVRAERADSERAARERHHRDHARGQSANRERASQAI
jgi:hypothetical protein